MLGIVAAGLRDIADATADAEAAAAAGREILQLFVAIRALCSIFGRGLACL